MPHLNSSAIAQAWADNYGTAYTIDNPACVHFAAGYIAAANAKNGK